jgi:DNA-binding SARP family transcriptional activator
MRMEIQILGPLKATISDVVCIPSASKPRRLFALLAVNAGQVVTSSELAEEIWEGRPPRSAMSTLHTYVLQLRKKLEAVLGEGRSQTPRDIVVTEGSGYVLDVDPGQVDAGRYERMAAAGRRAAVDGDDQAATTKLASALGLWRGTALADVEIGPHLGIETAWLEENRLADLELRIEVDLRLGRHQRLLGELAGLCVRYPMLEGFHAQYMLALYRSGRQWRALEIYQRLRALLVNQLGIDPTARVQKLHQAILNGDPALDDAPLITDSWVPVGRAAGMYRS